MFGFQRQKSHNKQKHQKKQNILSEIQSSPQKSQDSSYSDDLIDFQKENYEKNFACIFIQKNKIGISIFHESEIHCSCLSQQYLDSFDINSKILQILQRYQNITIIVPSQKIIVIQNYLEQIIEYLRDQNHEVNLVDLSKKEFEFDLAIYYLKSLSNLQEAIQDWQDNHRQEQIKFQQIQSIIDISQQELVISLGALLSYLISNKIIIQKQFSLNQIIMDNGNKLMQISQQSMLFLQIIKKDIHPSQIHGCGRYKDGYSIYTFFENQIKTNQGKKLLKSQFMNPSFDMEYLKDRQDSVEYFIKCLNHSQFKHVIKSLKNINDFNTILKKFVQIKSTSEDWYKLKQSIENSLIIISYFKQNEEQLNLKFVKNLLSFDEKQIIALNQLLDNCCNFKERSDTIQINFGLDSELDGLRNTYEKLDDILNIYAQNEYKKLPQGTKVKQLALCFLPQFGYLLTIPNNHQQYQEKIQIQSSQQNKDQNEQNAQIDNEQDEIQQFLNYLNVCEDWQYQFELEDGFYFKNDFTHHLDQLYGDIHGKIIDTEQAVLREIENEILNCSDSLIQTNKIIAEIDCLQCFAQIAIQFDLVKPNYEKNSMIMIQDGIQLNNKIFEGKHLLVQFNNQQDSEQFVSNDTFVYNYIDDYDRDFNSTEEQLINQKYSNRCSILTGPNYSGKSVYIKQIGIIVFLAQIGSFVPATRCRLGLFDKIITNGNQSQFNYKNSVCNDFNLAEQILKNSTNRSLILLDEFGKNLNYSDGISLFGSLVEQLIQPNFQQNQILKHENDDFYNKNNNECLINYNYIPISIMVTHFQEIYSLQIVQQNYLIRFLTMSYHLTTNQEKSYQDKIIYLYKIKPGMTSNSYGIQLAEQFIQDEYIIKRAIKIKQDLIENGEFQVDQRIIEQQTTMIENHLIKLKQMINSNEFIV